VSVSVPDQDATRFSVASSATSVVIFPANGRSGGRTIQNESSAILYLAFGSTPASLTDYTVQIAAGAYYEFPVTRYYGGEVRGIWAAANGNARCTEW
jgi:hypothetical protein